MDGSTYTSGVSANRVVASYVYPPGIRQTSSLHSALKRSYVAAVCYECFRVVGSSVCGTVSVDVSSETSWDDQLVVLHTVSCSHKREELSE